MDWKNTPHGVKEEVEKADKKAKSGGDPHGRTAKEKVKDVITGTGLGTKAKKIRKFAIGGAALVTGVAGNLASRAANIVKKAQAHKKE
jgi:hypothetical protein